MHRGMRTIRLRSLIIVVSEHKYKNNGIRSKDVTFLYQSGDIVLGTFPHIVFAYMIMDPKILRRKSTAD